MIDSFIMQEILIDKYITNQFHSCKALKKLIRVGKFFSTFSEPGSMLLIIPFPCVVTLDAKPRSKFNPALLGSCSLVGTSSTGGFSLLT